MTERNSHSVSTTDAINALRARGITNPEQLASSTSPDQVLAYCNWYDQQPNAKPGLLVWKMRTRGLDGVKPVEEKGTKRAEMRAVFADIAAKFPVSSVAESHQRLQRRRDYEQDCDGAMVVIEAEWPCITARCDACGFEAAYPFKALAAGVLPSEPKVEPRPVPDPKPQVPPEQHRPAQPDRVMARLSKHHAVKGTPQ